jgi:1-acyl-sn-glycerol-3-phosphate acyltransferase
MKLTTAPEIDGSRSRWLLYPTARLAIRMLVHALVPRLRVTGRHHLPHRGGVILTPNHISHFDSALMGNVVRRPLRYMAMQEMFEIPVVGPIVRFYGAFPIERDSADRTALRYAEQLLQQGQALVVYPEGRLSPDGELGPLLPGAILLALHARVPIIPVGISGSDRVMPYGPTCPRPTLAPVRVHIGEPLDFSHLSSLPRRAQRKEAHQQLEQAIREAVAVARET